MKTLTKCPPRTAVAYARYSSAGQRDVSIEQQLSDIRAYADREGYHIVREYADHARSGFKDLSARSEFNAMIASAASRGFDTVLCWKVDRFGRNRADSASFKQHLARLGVSVVYVMEPIPTGAAGVLTEGMLEAIAEWYSRNLSENVTRGMNDNAKKCLYNGTKLFGYTCGPDKHYMIVPEEAAVVRKIYDRYLEGYSAAAICVELNAAGLHTSRSVRFSPQTVLRLLSNERYTGVYIWKDIRVPGGMPAIVDDATFQEAQRMKKLTTRHVSLHSVDFLLSGKAFCGHCGRAMIGDSGTSRSGAVHYYYACQGHKNRLGCDKKSIRKDTLEDFVLDFIYANCFTPEHMERIADAVMHEVEERRKKSPLSGMEKELAETEKKISNINNAIAAGIWNSSTASLLSDLEEQATNLRANVGLLRYQESQLLDRDRVLFFLHKFSKLDRNSPVDRRNLIHYFLNSVYVYDDKRVKISINFVDGQTTIPLESLPDLPDGSGDLMSGVLISTHPNQIIFWYITRMD